MKKIVFYICFIFPLFSFITETKNKIIIADFCFDYSYNYSFRAEVLEKIKYYTYNTPLKEDYYKIFAVAVHESGNFKSISTKIDNNIFGMSCIKKRKTTSTGCRVNSHGRSETYAKYPNIDYSIKDFILWFEDWNKYREYEGDIFVFMKKCNYNTEDKLYWNKLYKILSQLLITFQ